MNLEPLVEVITREVMERLSSMEDMPAGDLQDLPRKSRKLLVLLPHSMPEEAPFWKGLGELEEVQITFILAHSAQRDDLVRLLPGIQYRTLEPGIPLSPLVDEADVLMFPFFPLECLARTATLTGGDQVSDALILALQRQKKAIVDLAELSDMKRHAAHLPKGFLEIIAGHLRTLADFKVIPMDVKALPGQIMSETMTVQPSGGKTVLTMEDVMGLVNSGKKEVRLPMGSIVTPLAHDLCKQNGIVLIFY
ncbi:MAG: hypothetical protein J7M18_06075 [Candidatus Eremiobacteraeota bacterium]|nr:hypothetical protein [Candidatus Eremiobacteraeota bacterium]